MVSNLPGRAHRYPIVSMGQAEVHRHRSSAVCFTYEFVESNTGGEPGCYSTFQAKDEEEEGKTLALRWAFRFGPTQDTGAEHLVPFILNGTDIYVQELVKLANSGT